MNQKFNAGDDVRWTDASCREHFGILIRIAGSMARVFVSGSETWIPLHQLRKPSARKNEWHNWMA